MSYKNTMVIKFADLSDPKRKEVTDLMVQGLAGGWCVHLADGDTAKRPEETLAVDIENFLTPIIERLDLMIDRSSKPSALCLARDRAGLAVSGDRTEGKVNFLLVFLGDLEYLMRRSGDYSELELSHIIAQVRAFIIKRVL